MNSLKIIFGIFFSFLFCFKFLNPTLANPFDAGNISNGLQLHQEGCNSCHNSMFPDGNGNEIYTKDIRKINTSKKLYSMVEFCAGNNNLGWFEEEIIDVSKYLNDSFYKFKN